MDKLIYIKVNGQEINTTHIESVNATVKVINCVFEFDASWDEYPAKVANFKRENAKDSITADIINNTCVVPAEVLAYKGGISVAVSGKNTDGKTERTKPVCIIKQTETIVEGNNTIEPTPNQYAQFVEHADARIDEYFEEHKSEFKGDPGEPGADGTSPTATVTPTSDGARVTITDKTGTTTATIHNGVDGDDYVLTDADKVEISNLTFEELKPIIESKMEFYKLDTEVSGTVVMFYHDGVMLDYNAIVDKYFDDKYFVYAECLGLTFIPCFPPTETDEAIEFISTYIYGGEVMVDRLIINSNNEGKFEEKYIAEKSEVEEIATELTDVKESLSELEEVTVVKKSSTVTKDITYELNWNNGYYDIDGVNPSSSYKYSNPIPVQEGDVITNADSYTNFRFLVALNGETRVKEFANIKTYTVPANITHVVPTVYTSAYDRHASLVTLTTMSDTLENIYKDTIEHLVETVDSTIEVSTQPTSSNLLDLAKITNGKYVDDDGTLANNSAYNTSDYIEVINGETYTFQCTGQNYRNIRTINFIAGYDANKTFVSGSYKSYKSNYTVPDGVKYIRFSRDGQWATSDEPAFVNASFVIPYEPYSEGKVTEYTVKRESIPFRQIIPNGIMEHFDLSSGGVHTMQTDMNHMSNFDISFFAKIGTFGDINISKGDMTNYSSNVYITSSKVFIYIDGSQTASYDHNLTFKDYINVRISTSVSGRATVTIMTNGGTYKTPDIVLDARLSAVKVIASSPASYTDCSLSYYCRGLEKDTWLYGDSYFSCGDLNRWTTYLVLSASDNFMLDGYGGRNSANAYKSFINCIKYNLPKRVVWCMGMNDEDTSTSVNSNWLGAYTEVRKICDKNNIELILATIPNVPSSNHTFKNDIVRNSGLRYIDFASAISPNGDSTWYDNMLSSDDVHPVTEGAKALYTKAISDVPELLS